FSRTALGILSLSKFGWPARKAEFDRRIERAVTWLRSTPPASTEDRNMQLLGVLWSRADKRTVTGLAKKLIAMQRREGGWAQTPYLESDAYATGQTLYALHEAGIPASHAACRRGADYLLRTQLGDGSWRVVSRSPKFQPYFESGFPHGHDQWISATATAWAATALSQSSGGRTLRSAR
ncbi:MAG: N-acyl-D-aspartate/D-glutamate deacylase, partial [Bryobacteraceae bacterium]